MIGAGEVGGVAPPPDPLVLGAELLDVGVGAGPARDADVEASPTDDGVPPVANAPGTCGVPGGDVRSDVGWFADPGDGWVDGAAAAAPRPPDPLPPPIGVTPIPLGPAGPVLPLLDPPNVPPPKRDQEPLPESDRPDASPKSAAAAEAAVVAAP